MFSNTEFVVQKIYNFEYWLVLRNPRTLKVTQAYMLERYREQFILFLISLSQSRAERTDRPPRQTSEPAIVSCTFPRVYLTFAFSRLKTKKVKMILINLSSMNSL